MFASRPFRIQLSFVIGAVILSVVVVVTSVLVLAAWKIEQDILATLSPAAHEVYHYDWSEKGMPAPELVEEISFAVEMIFKDSTYHGLYLTGLFGSLGLLAIGIGIGVLLARRLTGPLEKVAQSAAKIADGDFSHRLEISDHWPSEIRSLASSFADMAVSLERMERDIQYSSAATAHEIRTPLTIIQGFLQGIRDEVFDASPERFDMLLRHMDNLGRLIDDIQTLSLEQSGTLGLHFTDTDLRGEVEDAVTFVSGLETDSHIDFIAKIDRPGTFRADPDRIRQVVIGLLENACRYGGADVAIKVILKVNANVASLVVSDDGPGFSEAALLNAPMRFWRDEQSRSRHTGGSGLGLAVAQAIAEAHGGTLQLRNNHKGGAEVEVLLLAKPPSDP